MRDYRLPSRLSRFVGRTRDPTPDVRLSVFAGSFTESSASLFCSTGLSRRALARPPGRLPLNKRSQRASLRTERFFFSWETGKVDPDSCFMACSRGLARWMRHAWADGPVVARGDHRSRSRCRDQDRDQDPEAGAKKLAAPDAERSCSYHRCRSLSGRSSSSGLERAGSSERARASGLARARVIDESMTLDG